MHSDYLHLALSLGYELDKVNKVLVYKSTPWLKEYVLKNTTLRTAATTSFEKDLWKLMNNAVFGKCIENVRKRCHIKLANDDETFEKLTSQPTFKNFVELSETQTLIEMTKKSIVLNKPIYDGLYILDKSKELMARFFYMYLQPKFGERLELIMTDTDSFILDILSPNFYEEIREDIPHYFDTSNFTKEMCPHFPLGLNKKVPGFFKDETGGNDMIEKIVALRPKQYSYQMESDSTVKKCKGLTKQAMQTITFDDYEKELWGELEQHRVDMYILRSHEHTIYSEKISKKTLDRHDDKRLLCEDGIHTLPYGY